MKADASSKLQREGQVVGVRPADANDPGGRRRPEERLAQLAAYSTALDKATDEVVAYLLELTNKDPCRAVLSRPVSAGRPRARRFWWALALSVLVALAVFFALEQMLAPLG